MSDQRNGERYTVTEAGRELLAGAMDRLEHLENRVRALEIERPEPGLRGLERCPSWLPGRDSSHPYRCMRHRGHAGKHAAWQEDGARLEERGFYTRRPAAEASQDQGGADWRGSGA